MKKCGRDKILMLTICALVTCLVVVAIVWGLGRKNNNSPPVTTEPSDALQDTGQATKPTAPPTGTISADGTLSIEKVASFSGVFVEDGSDKQVDGVAAILVKNLSDRFLDLGNISYRIDGKSATFIVTGLPPGESAWVMEYSAMQISASSNAKYLDSTCSFRDDVIYQTDDLTMNVDGGFLVVRNNTDRTLNNIFVYYKSLHDDGNYFGGITYMVEFGSLSPGEVTQKLAAHYVEGETRIVRIGWQEGETPS